MKETTLAGYYVELMGQAGDRVTCPKIDEGVWAHLGNGVEGEDPCLYYNLDFTPRKYEYFDMFAQWFQTEWRKQRDGYSPLFGVRTKGITGPVMTCWGDPFKLSSFAKEGVEFIITKLPMEMMSRVLFHYAQPQDPYMAPVPHCKMRREAVPGELKMNRTAIRAIVVAEEEGERALLKYSELHGVNLCLNFSYFVCSYVVKDREIYYRPLGRDYYVRVLDWGKPYYKPRPVLQILDTLTGLFVDGKEDLYLRLQKASFMRWVSRGIDGYFMIFIPPRAIIGFDEMQVITITYYPHKEGKDVEDVRR